MTQDSGLTILATGEQWQKVRVIESMVRRVAGADCPRDLARLRLRPTRRVQLSAVSYQHQPPHEIGRAPFASLPQSRDPCYACTDHVYISRRRRAHARAPLSCGTMDRALRGISASAEPYKATAALWDLASPHDTGPRGAHTRGVHAKGDVYAISKT